MAKNQPYDNNATYYFNEQQKNITNREALYTKTDGLLNDFMNMYNSSTAKSSFTSNSEEFVMIIEDGKTILDLLFTTQTKKIPIINDIILAKNKEGLDNLTSYYKEYYNSTALANNPDYIFFQTIFSNYINHQILLLKILVDNDCVSGNMIKKNKTLTHLNMEKMNLNMKNYNYIFNGLNENGTMSHFSFCFNPQIKPKTVLEYFLHRKKLSSLMGSHIPLHHIMK